jgi:hypothetical protein
MKYASKEVKAALAAVGNPTLTAVREGRKKKHRETLAFLQEWTEDLVERENELQMQREDYLHRGQ